MGAEEVRVGHELIAEVVQTAHALQHDPAVQVEGERPAHHLAVDQLFQLHPDDAALAAEDEAVGLFFAAGGTGRVHQAEKVLLPDGLELVIPRIHRIGLHRKLRACGEEDDLYVGVVLPNLPGRRHPVLARHQNIQQHDVEAFALLDVCHQLHRALVGCVDKFLPSGSSIFFQQLFQLRDLCGFVVTECDFQHKGIYTVPSLVYYLLLLLLIV